MTCQTPNPCRTVRRCCSYTGGALGFLALVLAFAVGLIVGAYNYASVVPVLPAVIAFASVIAVIIIALLIYWWIGKHNCVC